MMAPLPGCSKGCGAVFATVEEARAHEATCTWTDGLPYPASSVDNAGPDSTTDEGESS